MLSYRYHREMKNGKRKKEREGEKERESKKARKARMQERKKERKRMFFLGNSFSEKLLTSQGHIGASQSIAQLRKGMNIGRAVH